MKTAQSIKMMYLLGYGPVNTFKEVVSRPRIRVVQGQKVADIEEVTVNVCYTQPVLLGGKISRQELLDDRFMGMDEIYMPAVLDAILKTPERRIKMNHILFKNYTEKVSGSLVEVAEAWSDLGVISGTRSMRLHYQATQILRRSACAMLAEKPDPSVCEVTAAAARLRTNHPLRRILVKIGHRDWLDISKAA